MYNKFQTNQRAIGSENSYKDKTQDQILIEKRAELFLNAAKKNPKRFPYRIKGFKPNFNYIKRSFHKKK